MDDVHFSAVPRDLEPAESSRQVASRHNHEVPDEPRRHGLYFDKAAFATPSDNHKDRNVQSKLKLIEKTMDQYSTSTLMIPIEDMETFLHAFHSPSNHPRAGRTPSEAAASRMINFFLPESVNLWKIAYQKRLGIDFAGAKERFRQVLGHGYPGRINDAQMQDDRLVNFYLCYIFFVDMILTTIRKPTNVMVDTSQSFQAAIARFEDLAQKQLHDPEFPSNNNKKTITYLLKFISDWMASDDTYRSSCLFHQSELSKFAKAYFSFLFAHSIENLTNRLA
jgi:hypothetical protein